LRRIVALMLAVILVVALNPVSVLAANKNAQATFEQEIANLSSFISIDANGFFQVNATGPRQAGVSAGTFATVKRQFTEINANLARLDRSQRPDQEKWALASNSGEEVTTESWGCLWYNIPKWALQAYGWFLIIVGGVYATAAMFANATIIGLPAGAVLGSLGIWQGITGSALLWYADNYYPDSGRTVMICF